MRKKQSTRTNPNAVARARIRDATRKFEGDLATPISINAPGWNRENGTFFHGMLTEHLHDHEVGEQRSAKFELLFKHYRIKTTDPRKWPQLAICLAIQFVPGMIAVEVTPRKSGPKGGKIWDREKRLRLVHAVDAIRSNGLDKALADLIKKDPEWSKFARQPASLAALYHESKKLFNQTKASEDDWQNAIRSV